MSGRVNTVVRGMTGFTTTGKVIIMRCDICECRHNMQTGSRVLSAVADVTSARLFVTIGTGHGTRATSRPGVDLICDVAGVGAGAVTKALG